MAFVLTYNSGVEQLINYFQRNDEDFLEAIPTFFTFAINKISTSLKALGLEVVADFTTTINSNVLQKPSLYRSAISLELKDPTGKILILHKRQYEYCRMYWPYETNTAIPQYYADIDNNNLLLVPTPDQAYNARLNFFSTLQYLDENNQTNWATEYAPQLLFKALIREGMIWCNLPTLGEAMPGINAEYDQEIQSLLIENKVRKYDRTSQGDLA